MRPLGAPPWKWRHHKGSDRHWHSEPISFKKCNPLEPSEQMTTGPILLQLLGFPPRTLQRYPTPFYKCTIFRQIRLWRPSSSQDQPSLCRAKGVRRRSLGTAPKSPSFVSMHFGDPRAHWINHLLAVPRRPAALSQHRSKFTIFRHIALRRSPSGIQHPFAVPKGRAALSAPPQKIHHLSSNCALGISRSIDQHCPGHAKGLGGALSTATKSPSFVKWRFGDPRTHRIHHHLALPKGPTALSAPPQMHHLSLLLYPLLHQNVPG